jgi:hypothetical protein
LIAIGRGAEHFHGQGTKVVQTCELDFAGVIHFLNPGHQRNANAMAELDAFEAKVENLSQHFVTGGVTMRIPASRE